MNEACILEQHSWIRYEVMPFCNDQRMNYTVPATSVFSNVSISVCSDVEDASPLPPPPPPPAPPNSICSKSEAHAACLAFGPLLEDAEVKVDDRLSECHTGYLSEPVTSQWSVFDVWDLFKQHRIYSFIVKVDYLGETQRCVVGTLAFLYRPIEHLQGQSLMRWNTTRSFVCAGTQMHQNSTAISDVKRIHGIFNHSVFLATAWSAHLLSTPQCIRLVTVAKAEDRLRTETC